VVDFLFYFVPAVVFGILDAVAHTVFFGILAFLWGLAVIIFCGMQVGQYGSSPGMRVAGLRCVKADTGQFIGSGMGILRGLIHLVASWLCFIPFVIDMLFPLWDSQKQTLADKMVGTVVQTAPKQGFSITPRQ